MQLLPSIGLSGFIKHYLFLNKETETPCNLRLFSDGNTGIVFSTGGTLTLDAQPLPNAFLYGQIGDYKDIFSDTPTELFIIVFRPDAFHRLFRISADELKDRILPLTDIAAGLYSSVFSAPGINKKIALAEAFFNTISATANPFITASLDYIIKQQGQVTIDQLTSFTGLHPRQLERKFTTAIGLSPKKFSGIVRIHSFLKHLRPQKLSLTQCAYESGYYDQLTSAASAKGAAVIAFHECSITGYTFARYLSKEQMLDLAEPIPNGPSVQKLITIAKTHKMVILAGLFEKDDQDNLYKAYICVDGNGLIAKYRKLHPFINPHLTPGNEYCIFDLFGWKCGILICYDNNIIENVRATRLLGADILFMPHVTMCTPSTRPGAGFVDPQLWQNKDNDPTSLRIEFEGLKGREWLMKWLPAAECTELNDQFVTATLIPEKLQQAGGYRYIQARRPDLYRDIISQSHRSEQKVVWLNTTHPKL